MELAEAFGLTFRHLRIQLGLNQAAFHTIAAASTLSRIERGHQLPALSMIEGLAKIMEIEPITLLVLTAAMKDGSLEGSMVIERVENELRRLNRLG
ncbi:helix-turn-helix domain-containing protein [Pseudomonas vranovensis]|uniref:HTH cro/C1-type domain-containing protein n=1 Tax=Pseudomonas vranovensis TaxID=321661 RepID=A0A423D4X9_9PSED|nr:helix-turn-helix transcriptional regulator [Pseudomonas vranovensis]ROL66610.1 hypothetical protein BHU25_20735 [Pseudomonas vranovensis]